METLSLFDIEDHIGCAVDRIVAVFERAYGVELDSNTYFIDEAVGTLAEVLQKEIMDQIKEKTHD